MASKEVWKSIVGFDNYEVSDYGRVRNKKSIILKPTIDNNGYFRVTLRSNGNQKVSKVHKLVTRAFFGESDLEVNHKDLKKTNNKLVNLEYVTHKENMAHAIKNGVYWARRHESHHNAKLTMEKAREIRKLKGKYSMRELALIFEVSRPTITHIQQNRTWKEVSYIG